MVCKYSKWGLLCLWMQNQDLFNKYCLLNTTPTGKYSSCREPVWTFTGNIYFQYCIIALTFTASLPTTCYVIFTWIQSGRGPFSIQLVSLHNLCLFWCANCPPRLSLQSFVIKELFLAGKYYVFFSYLHRFLVSRRKGLVGPIHLW